jgi:hypothetical protein
MIEDYRDLEPIPEQGNDFIADVIISLPEHEKWIKISEAINKAKKKRQEQGFQLGVIKGSLYSMGFEDAIEWLLGNEL